jgi:hypothetical protein
MMAATNASLYTRLGVEATAPSEYIASTLAKLEARARERLDAGDPEARNDLVFLAGARETLLNPRERERYDGSLELEAAVTHLRAHEVEEPSLWQNPVVMTGALMLICVLAYFALR